MKSHSLCSTTIVLQVYLCRRYVTDLIHGTAAGADASGIYLESFSFSLLCTIGYTHTVLPNFHIVTNRVVDVREPDVDRPLRFVTALLDFTFYSSLPFPMHHGPLYLYLGSHRTIVYAHGSPHIVTNRAM
jgi:hypothetical protein